MVILHVVAPSDVGGLERVVQGLAREQHVTGHDVHVAAVFTGARADDAFLVPLRQAGVVTHPFAPGSRGYGRERRAVARLCRALRPAVVHSHGYRPDVLDAGVARRAGVPTVTTVHGFTGGDWKNRVYEWLQTRAFRRFDAVVAVSRPLQLRLVQSGVPLERVHVVPNAWSRGAPALERADARRALGLPLDAFVVGWVGRLSPEKGPDVLLEALELVSDLPVCASFIGEGPARRQLEAHARRSHPDGESRVHWHGAVRDAGRLFTAFDLFVLSSRTEGSPIVLFEAMAAGVPVIATTVGGVPDTVSPEEAVLVPPEHGPALAAAIRAAYRTPELARARAARARERLHREFAPQPWAERYERIYRHVTTGAERALVPA